ncbi:(E)-beta-farnesene synthase-like [Rutidosis leptorrhynchoides]|uniref:(E)-beta-farnesene synthase-like n=1 Tax=Rutidosis leptorrhynchoides TaxID=125765 RepID=UPI003A9946F7
MSSLPISGSGSWSFPVKNVCSNDNQQVARNTMTFHSSIWGAQFLEYDEKDDIVVDKQLVEDLKEEVRKELMIKPPCCSSNEPIMQRHLKVMENIDVVQRLGISYHFEEEIMEALQHIYVIYGDYKGGIDEMNLKNISLWFRLLRQQGFNVSSGIFENHLDADGMFKKSLRNDALGMLALYEAACMRIEGEKVLDDALEFTKIHLAAFIPKNQPADSLVITQIKQALKQPLRKRLQRLEAVRYIPIYQQQPNHNEVILKLAKLDFNFLQLMHKKELSQICKWWKGLELRTKLPYVRDRLIEGYFWILAIYFEPQYSSLRIFLIRSCMWIIVIDDTFDNYGTYEELELFTKAIDRWSISCLDELPEYMQLIYRELLNVHREMEELLEKDGKGYQIHYIKEMAKEYTRSQFKEAKWVKDGYMPTLEEYMSNSLITCAYPLIIARSYVGRDDMVTEDTFKWVSTHPPLVKASCLVLRFMDDIATHKEEQERGHVASSIECYQKETGASEEEANIFLSKQVEDAWKIINRESLRPTDVPFPLLMPAINLARVCDALYFEGNDGYNHAGKEMKTHIESLFINPIVI